MAAQTVGGKLQRIGLDHLKPDPENPRFPKHLQEAGEDDILEYLAAHYHPIEVARSISRHGYFESEPMIAIRAPGGGSRKDWIVVEGNRRLAALKGLSDRAVRARYPKKEEWQRLARSTSLPATFPVVVAPSRDQVAAILGYRHVSGIEPWGPLPKARFIASLIDEGRSFDDVASEIGESTTSVRSHYRNQAILDQASTDFKIDTTKMEEAFGTFTRAMNATALRDFIGAPAPRAVERGKKPLPEAKRMETKELLGWLFGNGKKAAIRDSREISRLAAVLQDPRALALLRQDRELSTAYFASAGAKETLLKRLENAEALLDVPADEARKQKSDKAVALAVTRVSKALASLKRRLK